MQRARVGGLFFCCCVLVMVYEISSLTAFTS
jgi:hypothetical protein